MRRIDEVHGLAKDHVKGPARAQSEMQSRRLTGEFALQVSHTMSCCAQVRLFVRGAETVLSDAANPEELFATGEFETRWCARHSLLRTACSAAQCTCIPQPGATYFRSALAVRRQLT